MFQLQANSGRPIYEQIMEALKRLINSGALKPGDKAPSVTSIATQLTCNPSAIKKAYRELESEGFLYFIRQHGYFIAQRPSGDGATIETLYQKIFQLASELESFGESREHIAARLLQRGPKL